MLDSFPPGGTAAIIGATGGIGSAVADAVEGSGAFARVARLSRRSAPPLDLTSEASIEAAAASLGASWWNGFLHIVLPLAKPGLVGAGIVVLTLSLTDFAMPAILGGGSQDFIANAVYDQFFRTSDQGMGAALTVALVALGSLLVGAVFAFLGAGTLALGRDAP